MEGLVVLTGSGDLDLALGLLWSMDAMDEICAVVGYIGSYGFLDPILLFLVLFMLRCFQVGFLSDF